MAGVTQIASTSSLPPVESTGSPHGNQVPLAQNVQSPSQSLPQAPPMYVQTAQLPLVASGDLSRPGMDQSIPWRAPSGGTDSPSYTWPDAPNADVEDNEKLREPAYKMTQAITKIDGYENTSINESKPAERPPLHIHQYRPRGYKSVCSNIPDAEAKHALVDLTAQHCCFGKRTAIEMEIRKIEYSSATKYTLETFVESRTTKLAYIPYKGQNIDSPRKAAPPALWDVPNPSSATLKPSVTKVRVPHSSTVETCFACTGRGFNKCFRCKGRGRTKCKHCKATGHKKNEDCVYCHGKGGQRCFRCNGHGVISCSICEAYKLLELYIMLTSTLDVKRDEFLHHTEKRLPRKLVTKGVVGVTLFEEAKPLVAPVTNFPVAEVNSQSEKFAAKHGKVKTERIVRQSHKLVKIPIAEVQYTWKGKESRYWIYGQQPRKVYAPDYPQQCCCKYKCSIL
ncbi:protein SSUH2 homolog isoform X1 [Asterias amurensis]|uniref:protein SSUH2 homolog isoform X1 n=1 Tax=Asterias amurensis TaxID=7602 RepID=UPI003AB1FC1F